MFCEIPPKRVFKPRDIEEDGKVVVEDEEAEEVRAEVETVVAGPGGPLPGAIVEEEETEELEVVAVVAPGGPLPEAEGSVLGGPLPSGSCVGGNIGGGVVPLIVQNPIKERWLKKNVKKRKGDKG